ncbi:DUF2892 domain-containing protein [Aquamicrobium sp.]|uniref:YgaP family membrane protein n=1 Tax=Aquamicrobium sp. TaxID=1872579 RepID=UPI002586988A|nr:DUF2892 domain-containing protein [Aquamicrobium sp.]MCK9554149.1 DUF2892 domain-containing protein [Aquamicrobium sp.]
MRINIGTPERMARLVLGAILLVLAFVAGLPPLWAWIAGIVGVVMIVTGALRFCPAWSIFGINTDRGSK